jgi:polyisoprenyl-phosphate glycosyltransferase
MLQHTIILLPVFNDGESLGILLSKLDTICHNEPSSTFSVLIINDGSTEPLAITPIAGLKIKLLHLQRNIGHQKAIAIGLAYIKHDMPCDKVLVMDSDGEDKPEDAMALFHSSLSNPGKIVFAYRKSRQEGNRFIFFYALYKAAFRLLTGRTIAFGNFLIIPRPVLDKIVFYSEIWNHIAGGILKSGLSYTSVETHRGKRYASESKMNFNSLLLHGLGAVAVFMDIIATRLLIFSFLLIAISSAVIVAILCIKIFTDLGVPGWASSVGSAFMIILLQGFLLSLFTIFLYLISQGQRKFIPAHHYRDYTGSVETIK